MLWDKTLELLQSSLSSGAYDLWIAPLTCLEIADDNVRLATPDRYFSAYVSQNYLSLIEQSLQEAGAGVHRQIIFTEGDTKAAPVKPQQGQLRLPHVPENTTRMRALHPRYTFEQYMVGECNILAESACKAISMLDDSIGPCVYINSDTGLGKSHLTHAVAHMVFATSPMTRLHYVTAKQFSAEMVRGIQSRTMDSFKKKYHEGCDILLVEDVHTLTGKKKTQEELNDLLDNLIKTGKRVVLTANGSPRELVGIDGEFRSRMSSGLVTQIKAPDLATRTRIVEKKAEQLDLSLQATGVDFLAQHIRGDIRQVESAIIAIRAKSRLQDGHVDMELIRSVVASVVGKSESLTVAMISELIARQFNVSMQELKSRSRKKKLSFPRQVAMYLSRKYTQDSLADIGKAFNRDHSTVLHSIKKVTDLSVRDTSIGAQVELLSEKIASL